MGDSSRFFTGLVIGAAAGAAIAILLNTKKGQEFIADLRSAALKVGDDLKAATKSWEEDLPDTTEG